MKFYFKTVLLVAMSLMMWLTANADVTLWVRASQAPHIYVEGSGTESLTGYNTWPGKTLEQKMIVDDGNTWWKCQLEGVNNIPKLIINNGNSGGNNQTTDITNVTGTCYYHYNNYGFYLDLTKARYSTQYCFFQPMIKGSSSYDWTQENAVFYVADDQLVKCGGYNTPYNGATDVYLYVKTKNKTDYADGARFTFFRKKDASSTAWNRILVQYHKGGYYQNTGWGDTNTKATSGTSWQNATAYTAATWYGAEECSTDFRDIQWPIEVDPRPVKVLTSEEAQAITFQWTENGVTHNSNLTEKATNPRHMIALLKTAFMNKNVPGNIYRGYDSEYQPQELVDYTISDLYTSGKKWGGWNIAKGVYTPKDEGLTLFLIELTDSYTKEAAVAATITTENDLANYFSRFVKSVQLLTQSHRIEDGRSSTTSFSYSGNLSRFFLIAKGKCNSAERLSTDAPFGDAFLYEELSPVDNRGVGADDLYARLAAGESFSIQHDCPSVIARGHEFEMKKGTTDYYDVSNLLFSIPDYRLLYHDNRKPQPPSTKDYYNYHPKYQPSTVLYTVTLTAEAVSSETAGKFTVNLQWTSALGLGASVDIPQIYKLYRVVNGAVSGDPIFVGQDITTWSEEVDQLQQGYHLTYMVSAQPVDLSLPQAQSNNAQVTIPGTDPLERLVLVINGDANSVFDPAALTNTYTNHIELRNGTGNSVQGRYIEVGTAFEFYRLDSLDNELKHLADLKFTAVSARKYNYQVLVDGRQTATGSFASDTDWGDINFNGFTIIDEFAVSTADNKHPGMYKYQASFLPPANVEIPGAEGARIYSNKLEVNVFKTYATSAPEVFTQEQVDADIIRPEQPLDTRTGLTLTLDNSSQLFNYELLRSEKGSWVDTGAHAQRQNSGHYMVHDGMGNSEEVTMSETQSMMAQLIADGAMQGQAGNYDYVPVIMTFPVYGDYDHYNTYGADVHTSYVSSVSVQPGYPIASSDTFNDGDTQCRYYEAHLTVTPNMPDGVEPKFVRVWKFLPDDVAHEVKAEYKGRLDLTQRCLLYQERPYESSGQLSPAYDIPVDGKSEVDIYDYFGGIDVMQSDEEFTAKYVVRVYGTLTASSPNAATRSVAKAESVNNDTMWCVAENNEISLTFSGTGIITKVEHVTSIPSVCEVNYYNLQGFKSNRPWPGVNLVMTRYSDGTTTTTKVVK